MIAARLLFAGAALLASPGAGPAPVESAVYRLSGPSPWRWVKAVESAGYRVTLASADGLTLEARVEVDGSPLPDGTPFPSPEARLSPEARVVLAQPRPADPEADRLGRELTAGSRSTLEAVERVIAFTSRRIRYALPSGDAETAAAARLHLRGSCVGRSLLAADLLLRVGIPARQVTGLLVASSPSELTRESRAVWNPELGGVRHRWIEVFVPGLGWVPSDPGGLANTVTARHLALSEQPPAPFRVETASRSSELKRVALAGDAADAPTWARPRGASLFVRNVGAPSGGAVMLTPVGDDAARAPAVVARTETSSVTFERVPPGDYRVLWRSRNGRVEAASVRVSGSATLDLTQGDARR